MRYSFIIPVYNRPDEVDELLESLTRQTDKDFEVIVVEDGSSVPCKEVERRFCREINELFRELEQGHDVIACVDGGELSGNLEQEEFEDRWIGEIPDHVVLVRNIDYSEPPRVEVYDVAMEEPVRYYPLDRFIDSWKDSKYYMISIK